MTSSEAGWKFTLSLAEPHCAGLEHNSCIHFFRQWLLILHLAACWDSCCSVYSLAPSFQFQMAGGDCTFPSSPSRVYFGGGGLRHFFLLSMNRLLYEGAHLARRGFWGVKAVSVSPR